MANKVRFRSGRVHLAKVRVDSAAVIERSDLVYLDTDDAKPASSFPWDTDLPTTQSGFAALFLGVAHEQSANGDTDPISVDLSPDAVYEFDVASATYEVGDALGPDQDGANTQLMDQQLEAVASGSLGIARAAEYHAAATTALRVTLASAYYTGSANVNAALG
ncbi:MAG: hypothetical protein ACOC46_04710 [Pirellulales bacterium]